MPSGYCPKDYTQPTVYADLTCAKYNMSRLIAIEKYGCVYRLSLLLQRGLGSGKQIRIFERKDGTLALKNPYIWRTTGDRTQKCC